MHEKYIRGLASAIARNQRMHGAARSQPLRRYYQGRIDGMRASLCAWLALSTPGTPDEMIREQVSVAVLLAERRESKRRPIR